MNIIVRFISGFFFILIFSFLSAQSPYMLRGDQSYHTYDRSEILKMGDTTMVNSINNYDRLQFVKYFKAIKNKDNFTPKDHYDFRHIFADNVEFLSRETSAPEESQTGSDNTFRSAAADRDSKETPEAGSYDNYKQSPFLKYFYKSRANFLEVETPSFSVYINPVLQVSYLNQKNNDNIVFQNTRGIDIRGYIDKKVYFYTQLLENQRSYLNYVDERIQKFSTIPGQGGWKLYNSSIFNNLKGYDFFNARAYIGFNPVKSINMEFGHGNHFIGNGYRSLLLSDYSHNYFYLKFNTRIWKFQYQNIFAELAPIPIYLNPGNKLLPKKYTATHYLAFKPNSSFEIGLFETVIFARPDHFEFQYLNPVILYRAVENFLNSPDNVMLGLNLKWNPVKGVSLYGQLLLDEFKLSEIKANTGWWANKYGGQIGIKYINALGIDHLDIQLEYNAVRPYTYSHFDTLPGFPNNSIANYSHVNQPLGHPLGANFKELIVLARYKPDNKIYLQAKLLLTTYGGDRPGENWGGNILLPYTSRQTDYGNFIGQGISSKIFAINADASYEIYHNYFIDLQAMWRQTTTDVTQNQHFIGGGFRVNISNITYDY
jgi:hypothetical protein